MDSWQQAVRERREELRAARRRARIKRRVTTIIARAVLLFSVLSAIVAQALRG